MNASTSNTDRSAVEAAIGNLIRYPDVDYSLTCGDAVPKDRILCKSSEDICAKVPPHGGAPCRRPCEQIREPKKRKIDDDLLPLRVSDKHRALESAVIRSVRSVEPRDNSC